MLEILARQELTVTTLLLTFLLPFAVFALNVKDEHFDGTLKFHDFVLMILSLAAAGFAISKLAFETSRIGFNEKILNIVHIGPPVLTLLLISKLRQFGLEISRLREGRSEARPESVPVAPPVASDDPTAARAQAAQNQDDTLSWADLILNEEVYREVTLLLRLFKNASAVSEKGLHVPGGVLLQGPPGTGKTSIARLLARSTNLAFYTLHTSDIMGGALQTDKRLMELLNNASKNAPALIFIDEIDLIGKCRDTGPNPQADGVLRQLLQLIDEIEKTPRLYLVAATNRSDLVDEALKRPGRLTKVISTSVPDMEEREAIFRLCLSRLSVDEELDLSYSVEKSDGASGATIKAICNQAGINSLQRFNLSEDLQGNWSINEQDLNDAVNQYMRRVGPKLSLVSN